MDDVAIRAASSLDLDALLDLYTQLSPANSGTDVRRAAVGLREILERPGISLLVAERGNRVVGTVTLVVVPNLTHGARPWIQLENMVVDGGIQRSGIGRALIEAAFDLARETGAYKIQLQSADTRSGAHRFYEAHGFVASSRGYRLYLDSS